MQHLEGAFDGFIFAHVQGLDQLLDLVLSASILSLPPRQLLPLLSEVGVLVQRLLVHMTAPEEEHFTIITIIVHIPFKSCAVQVFSLHSSLF